MQLELKEMLHQPCAAYPYGLCFDRQLLGTTFGKILDATEAEGFLPFNEWQFSWIGQELHFTTPELAMLFIMRWQGVDI